ncbi:hypothetical protein MIND_01264600 [Mycena indigotica]|uniref:Uncharacterized protein n=1 Tax=Mycena indigotica TaxID=2126181 RepID=A0A8H6VRD1_9AGAR|nr:uncharacterized protein MIND_01264600 [Mycena indigotica]KAF7291212.1 hypothetical protein MIND_01264600 [Mycena indigotica]
MRRSAARSARLTVLGSSNPSSGIFSSAVSERRFLNSSAIKKYRIDQAKAMEADREIMDSGSLDTLRTLQNLANDDEFDASDLVSQENITSIADVLDGTRRAEISHAGGDFEDVEGLLEQTKPSRARYHDWRTRRERTQTRVDAFAIQAPQMLQAYLRFCADDPSTTPLPNQEDADLYRLTVIEMFETKYNQEIWLDPSAGGIASALIAQGLIPCAPWSPSLAISFKTLKFYRVAHARCPQYTINAFVQTLNDLHGFLFCENVAVPPRRAQADDANYVPGRTKAQIQERHATDQLERDTKAVEELELKLDIVQRWKVDDTQYQQAEKDALALQYRQTVDHLELLVVQRLLELSKLHRSETCYKMRTHLGKSIQVRSKTVRAAVEKYNLLAVLQDPPKPTLEWKDVATHTFLSEFNLLRDSTHNVQQQRWARPVYCDLMHRYYKTLRAQEEILRLNVEIRRLMTWMRDNYEFLKGVEASLRDLSGKSPEQAQQDLLLAVQLAEYTSLRHRFDETHRDRFKALAKQDGFTGSLAYGDAVRPSVVPDMMDLDVDILYTLPVDDADSMPDIQGYDPDDEDSDDEGDDARTMHIYLISPTTWLVLGWMKRSVGHGTSKPSIVFVRNFRKNFLFWFIW